MSVSAVGGSSKVAERKADDDDEAAEADDEAEATDGNAP